LPSELGAVGPLERESFVHGKREIAFGKMKAMVDGAALVPRELGG
jgi:hypothetical protein